MVLLLLTLFAAPQDDAAATDALAAFETAFQKKDSGSRVAAVSGLTKVQHEKIVSKLGSLLSNDDKAVRAAAAQALGGYANASPELKRSASHALSSSLSAGVNLREPESIQAILAALGTLQDESAVTPIKAHFDDKDIRIASAAVNAAGSLKQKNLIEPLIELLRDCEKTLKSGNNPAPSGGKAPKVSKKAPSGGGGGGSDKPDPETVKRDRASNLIPTIQQVLTALTGQNLTEGSEWEKWWSKNRSTFTINK